jgi:hypothetical protein
MRKSFINGIITHMYENCLVLGVFPNHVKYGEFNHVADELEAHVINEFDMNVDKYKDLRMCMYEIKMAKGYAYLVLAQDGFNPCKYWLAKQTDDGLTKLKRVKVSVPESLPYARVTVCDYNVPYHFLTQHLLAGLTVWFPRYREQVIAGKQHTWVINHMYNCRSKALRETSAYQNSHYIECIDNRTNSIHGTITRVYHLVGYPVPAETALRLAMICKHMADDNYSDVATDVDVLETVKTLNSVELNDWVSMKYVVDTQLMKGGR